jgi:hypothetical protein
MKKIIKESIDKLKKSINDYEKISILDDTKGHFIPEYIRSKQELEQMLKIVEFKKDSFDATILEEFKDYYVGIIDCLNWALLKTEILVDE